MDAIEKQQPVNLTQDWGVSFSDYKLHGKKVDFQTVIFLELFNGVIGIAPEVTVGAVRADTVSEMEQILLQLADFNSF